MDEWIKWGAVPVVGFIVWLVRLEGRINGHDSSFQDVKDNIKDMRSEVHYIRQRIDEAIDR